jgi:C1A family cysteine protease
MKTQNEQKKIKKITRILNCDPSRQPEKDWTIQDAEEVGLVKQKLAAAIPLTKDLRADWWKIRNQGDHGACVGFAIADSLLRWYLVQANRIAKEIIDSPSVRFIWMSSKETDEFTTRPTTFLELPGTSIKAALDIARKFGVVHEKDMPFDPEKLSHLKETTFYSHAANYRITSYFNLSGPLPPKILIWKAWLAQNGPIAVRTGVDRTWDNVQIDGKLDVYYPDTVRGYHAVAIVGYTKDRFIVRNSWGTDWGDKGFGYASWDYVNKAFTEAYGIKY